jgi:hypothetical protein
MLSALFEYEIAISDLEMQFFSDKQWREREQKEKPRLTSTLARFNETKRSWSL